MQREKKILLVHLIVLDVIYFEDDKNEIKILLKYY